MKGKYSSTLVSVSVQTDGPCAGIHSIIGIGAAKIQEGVGKTFFTRMSPLTGVHESKYLVAAGISHEQHQTYGNVSAEITAFANFVRSCGSHPVFVSADVGTDWPFVQYYMHIITGSSVFDTVRSLPDLVDGFQRELSIPNWWRLLVGARKTINPLQTAKDQAYAVLELQAKGLQL